MENFVVMKTKGIESVWDYPRPPRCEKVSDRIKVIVDNEIIADSTEAYRVLETSHPPTYYIPSCDIRMDLLKVQQKTSVCEFKGMAIYWSLEVDGKRRDFVAWSYPTPSPKFHEIRDYLCFYASKADACYVNDEKVQPQKGDFYGGWITTWVKGPFKGGPGTWGW